MGEVPFIAEKLAHQAFGQLGDGMPIIDLVHSQATSQDFALIGDDQVQFKAEEPADGGFAKRSTPVKDAMGVDTRIVTDRKGGGIDKADTRTLPQEGMQIGHQGHQHRGHQLH